MKLIMVVVLLITVFISCSDGSQTQGNTNTGVFLDSPVTNIGYITETQNGFTNSQGQYKYLEGETVTFFIGELEFPSVTASGTVTPLNLANTEDTSNSTVVNIIRLLQTIDQDGDPDNGITINSAAISSATQVDFSLSQNDFESSPAVTNLIQNSGSSNTNLISADEALANFEQTLAEEGEEFIANSNISGLWTNSTTDNDFLALIFFTDGTYIHLEVDEVAPIDEMGEMSGMERGTYSRNASTGELTLTQTFDNNGDTGLSDGTTYFAQVSGDTLTLQFDDNQNGTIDGDESLGFQRK